MHTNTPVDMHVHVRYLNVHLLKGNYLRLPSSYSWITSGRGRGDLVVQVVHTLLCWPAISRVWGVPACDGRVRWVSAGILVYGTFDWRLWRTHCGCGDGWPSRTLGRGEGRGRPPSSCPLRREEGSNPQQRVPFQIWKSWGTCNVQYKSLGQAWKHNLIKTFI